jgi:outer membrane protein assembly factor BamB
MLGLPLGLAAPALALAGSDEIGPPAGLQRWPTGDTGLAPPGLADGSVVFSGAALAGAIAPGGMVADWRRAHGLPGGTAFRPRTAGGRAILGGRGGLLCLDLDDGSEAWRVTADIQMGVPAVAHGFVVHGDGHRIVARDLATGAIHWRFDAVTGTQMGYAPCILGQRVFAGPGDGRLYALRLADGRPDWTVDGRPHWKYLRQIHAADGRLVAGSYNEQLLGIDPETGAVTWEFVAGNFINSHHLAAGLACLWSPTGWVYALDIRSGQIRWRLIPRRNEFDSLRRSASRPASPPDHQSYQWDGTGLVVGRGGGAGGGERSFSMTVGMTRQQVAQAARPPRAAPARRPG